MVETCLCMRNADKFGLRAVDAVAKNPTAGGAVRVHQLPTIRTFAAGTNAGDENLVTWFERRDRRPNLIDDADAFMTQNASRLTTRNVPFQNMGSPQIVVFVILMIASVGAVISGLGRSSTAFFPGP